MSTKRIFVGNLNRRTTERQLTRYLEDVGPVESVQMRTDSGASQDRSYALVEFETEAAAAMAIAVFNGRRLAGRVLHVRLASDLPPRRRMSLPAAVEPQRWDEPDDDFDLEPIDHKPRRDWRDMRRSKRSL